jgi:hypothetical protein
VKRLLRVDNEAVSVKLKVITVVELNANKRGEAGKDNPDAKPFVSRGFNSDPKDLGLDLPDGDDEGRDVDIDSDFLQEMTAGCLTLYLTPPLPTQKSSHMAVAGPTQFSNKMFCSTPPRSPSAAPVLLRLLVVGTLPPGPADRTSWQS